MKPIQAIIFDVDGLLLDTEPIFVKSCEEITGHKLTQEFHLQLMGSNAHDCGILMTQKYGIGERPNEFMARLDARMRELLPDSELMPGAANLIRKFKSMNIPMAAATGSSRTNFNVKTSHHQNLFSMFQSISSGDEVNHGKPSPEIFQLAMKRLGITDPETALVFEDSPAGVKCANNAGIPVVMVPNPYFPLEESLQKYDAHPTKIIKSLEDFDFSEFEFCSK